MVTLPAANLGSYNYFSTLEVIETGVCQLGWSQ